MSPIYTRPIREQLEHDRVIRQLQQRYKRKHEVVINPGAEQAESVTAGSLVLFPDLVLFSSGRVRKLEGTVEVETAESVHLLEARAQWAVLCRLSVPFHLYIPPQMLDTARRICQEQQFDVSEIWTYHAGLDQQVRFTQVYKSPNPPRTYRDTASRAKSPAKPVAKPAAKAVRGVAKAGPDAKAKPAAKARSAAKAGKPRAAKTTPAARTKPAAKATPAAKAVKKPASKAPARSAKPAAKARPSVKAKAKPPAKAKTKAGAKKRR